MACFFAAFSVSFSFLISYFLVVMIPAEMGSRKFSEGTNGYSQIRRSSFFFAAGDRSRIQFLFRIKKLRFSFSL